MARRTDPDSEADEDLHRSYAASLSPEETQLLVLRKILYEGDWGELERDLGLHLEQVMVIRVDHDGGEHDHQRCNARRLTKTGDGASVRTKDTSGLLYGSGI